MHARDGVEEDVLGARCGERELADVVREVEVDVVDPVGAVQPERHVLEPPSEVTEPGQPLGDERPQVREVEGDIETTGVEDREAADVPCLPRRLEPEEGRVEAGQLDRTGGCHRVSPGCRRAGCGPSR